MKRSRRFVGLLIAFTIVVFTYLVIADKTKKSYLYYDFGAEVPKDYSYLGIDVSHHQGEINWKEVSAMKSGTDSIDFAYIKASEGTNYTDDKFLQNVSQASENNIEFGLYHFFRPEFSAQQQALFFSQKCLAADDTLRPMLDVEKNSNYSKSRLLDSVYVFIKTFNELVKMKPIIYTYESFYHDYFEGSYLKHELFWIANYNGETQLIEEENVIVWQFSEKGTVNGIETKVDLNVAKSKFKEVMYQD